MPGVVAVALGGSWTRGGGDAFSDVDLGIYYEARDIIEGGGGEGVAGADAEGAGETSTEPKGADAAAGGKQQGPVKVSVSRKKPVPSGAPRPSGAPTSAW